MSDHDDTALDLPFYDHENYPDTPRFKYGGREQRIIYDRNQKQQEKRREQSAQAKRKRKRREQEKAESLFE